MFNYAQIDENGIVISVSSLSGEIVSDEMIQVKSYDISMLGKLYNQETGEFE